VTTRRLLGLAAIALAVLLAGCPAEDETPVEVSLAELVAEQREFDGRDVETQGVVRTFDEPRHYWIEDDHPNRVELLPDEVAEPYVGQEVRVTGRFSYADDRGRVIEVDEITPIRSDG
jgi:hypothetical protein